jgi:diguanylate cyclase (GGDEF)-like protein
MKLNLQRQLTMFFIISLICAAILVFPTYLIYSNSETMIISDLGGDALGVAATIANFIEIEIEPYQTLNNVEDYTTESYDQLYYEHMLSLFHQIVIQTKATYVYTIKRVSETEFAYILDGEDPDSEGFSPLGTVELFSDEMLTVFNEDRNLSTDMIYNETWNERYLSGYSPINDPITGEVIGIVGVDYAFDTVAPLISRLQKISAVAFVMFVFTLAFIFTKLIESRTEAMEIDYLTGLFNKRYFDRHLKINITDARIREQPLSLLMIDIDEFKSVNDVYGHLEGDVVLRAVADTLKSSIRRLDICSRYGGDEFSVILPDSVVDQAFAVAETIISSINGLLVLDKDNRPISLSVSIGIGEWKHNMGVPDLINAADAAMYASKAKGKGKISLFQ